MHKQRGFTLVELLVVIAIISILAGLLLPALGSALDSARVISCQGNIKQAGLGLFLYADDYDGWGPAGPTSWSFNPINTTVLYESVADHLGDPAVLRCPTDANVEVDVGSGKILNLTGGRRYKGFVSSSYHVVFGSMRYADTNWKGWFGWRVNQGGGAGLPRMNFLGRRVTDPETGQSAQVDKPSEQPVLVDNYRDRPQNLTRPDTSRIHVLQEPWTNMGNILLGRSVKGMHINSTREGMNITYADGHAKWYADSGNPFDHHPTDRAAPGFTKLMTLHATGGVNDPAAVWFSPDP
ncbi:MAG: type II secretion system protein [Planctomycetota bacterium]|jgi:prepilin-type N-terminal cleavage/methylation domain-containing protein/prepilin-type processing-associated H-X9-DG protein